MQEREESELEERTGQVASGDSLPGAMFMRGTWWREGKEGERERERYCTRQTDTLREKSALGEHRRGRTRRGLQYTT